MPFSSVMSLNLGIGLGSVISITNPPNPSDDWYNKETGMITCSNDLLECNEELITCL